MISVKGSFIQPPYENLMLKNKDVHWIVNKKSVFARATQLYWLPIDHESPCLCWIPFVTTSNYLRCDILLSWRTVSSSGNRLDHSWYLYPQPHHNIIGTIFDGLNFPKLVSKAVMKHSRSDMGLIAVLAQCTVGFNVFGTCTYPLPQSSG